MSVFPYRFLPLAAAVGLLACGSSVDVPPPTSPLPSCTPSAANVIVRIVGPGATSVEELNAEDVLHCQPTIELIRQTAPQGAGWCTTVALAADNPGYDLRATPPPPLRHVVASIGGSC